MEVEAYNDDESSNVDVSHRLSYREIWRHQANIEAGTNSKASMRGNSAEKTTTFKSKAHNIK